MQYTQLSPGSHQSGDERIIWLLANILFNDGFEDDISARVPARLRPGSLPRIKKDRLSRLWSQLIREKQVDNFGSLEERAILLLCSHSVDEACRALIQSGNLHLASLVAQIGRDPTTQSDMKKQIETWRQHNMYSEMEEPIRALYELLAGNALVSEGKSGGPLEDRISTFSFTERFGLDWLQAFGLRLWYSITADEPIEAAVSKFAGDLASGSELAFPSPPHLGEGAVQSGSSTDSLGRESPLWVLLKVYAATAGGVKDGASTLEFPAALLPESVSGDALTNRLSFQLHQMLASTVGQYNSFKIDVVQADHLTYDYTWELASSGQLEQALFVLLHLSHAADREWAVKDMLARFAPKLPSPVSASAADSSRSASWRVLTADLQLPEAWIWVAKALYCRDIGDATGEVDCLIRGKNWNDAHATFCRIVAPSAVIERDYDTLKALLSGFSNEPEKKVSGWASGGGVYEDFVVLATTTSAPKGRDRARLSRLMNALNSIGERIRRQNHVVEGLEERVAFQEMGNAVVAWTMNDPEVSFHIHLLQKKGS